MIVIQAYNCAAVGRSANSYRSPDETSYRYAPHNFVIQPHQSAPSLVVCCRTGDNRARFDGEMYGFPFRGRRFVSSG